MDLLPHTEDYQSMPTSMVRKKTSWTPPPSPRMKTETGDINYVSNDTRGFAPDEALVSGYTHQSLGFEGHQQPQHPLLANPILPSNSSFHIASANHHGDQLMQQLVMESHMFPDPVAYTFSPDGSVSMSPSPAPFAEFAFLAASQQHQHQQQQSHQQHPVQYYPNQQHEPQMTFMPQLAALHEDQQRQQHYMFPGFYSATPSEDSYFFSGSEYFQEQIPLHQNRQSQIQIQQQPQQYQQQHSSSICMAPTLFNSSFMNLSTIPTSATYPPTLKQLPQFVETAITTPIRLGSLLSNPKSTVDSLLSPTSPQFSRLPATSTTAKTIITTTQEPTPALTKPSSSRQRKASPIAARASPYPTPVVTTSRRPTRQAATIASAATAAIIATTTPSPAPQSPEDSEDEDNESTFAPSGSQSPPPTSYQQNPQKPSTTTTTISSSDSTAAATTQPPTNSPASADTIYNKWSIQEDSLLRAAVARVTKNHTTDVSGKWNRIATLVPGRTPTQCSARWQGALNQEIVRGKWTAREDKLLIKAVEDEFKILNEAGEVNVDASDLNWQKLSTLVPGRTSVQCAARYQEALDPDIRKGKWLDEEDVLLIRGLEKYGKSWVKIAAGIPNRTQRQCRTRWLQMFPKLDEDEKRRMEELCGSPIAVNEKIKKKKNRRRSGAAGTASA
ncbi:UNVERIFIED_CONTAM: Myb-like DNA-binding domain protein [Siphonaria sp. JEL0065]|nr:Myb-like DNA-binding domain protein [Siphonaria sp. JEL0065]